MKFKEGVIITKNADEHIIVAAGDAGKSFSGMIKMNGTAAFIAECLENDISTDELTEAVYERYDVTREKAKESVLSVINKFESVGLIKK